MVLRKPASSERVQAPGLIQGAHLSSTHVVVPYALHLEVGISRSVQNTTLAVGGY